MLRKNKIEQKGNNNIALQNSSIKIISNYDEVSELLKKGEIFEATALFERIMLGIQAQHPAHPHWKYDIRMGDEKVIVSHKPNYPEAVDKYPLKGNINFDIPPKYKDFKNFNEIIQHAYGKQESIELDVNSLKTWIGEHRLHEIRSSNSTKLRAVIPPRSFPQPLPMKLYFKKSNYAIDYLVIGVTRIEGSVITLENKMQKNAKIFIKLIVDLQEQKANFSIRISENYQNNVEANLLFSKFFIEVRESKEFALKILELGKDVFLAKNFTFDEPLSRNIDEYVEWLQDLIEIQDEFGIEFKLPENMEYITKEDIENINILKSIVTKQPRIGTYTDLKFSMNEQKAIRNLLNINKENSKGFVLLIEHQKSICLFDSQIDFENYNVEYRDLTLKNPELIKNKLKTMEEGESINIVFIPYNNSKNNFFENYLK